MFHEGVRAKVLLHMVASAPATHHFVVDLMEVDFTDFLHHVLVLKGYEAES